jgi:hypothetical protein
VKKNWTGSFTIEFNVSGQNGMEYIDLQKSYMYVRAKIMKTNGDKESDSDKVGVVNLFLPSLFVLLHFNEK